MSIGDYTAILEYDPSLTFFSLLAYFLLGLMRLIPIVILAPFLGSRLPGSVKMGLAIAINVILLPAMIMTSKEPLMLDGAFMYLALKELMVGLMIGFLATIPFYIAESSGILIDHMRGSASIMAMDPLMQTQVSPLGILLNQVLIIVFFEVGGPFLFLNAVMQSYAAIPAEGFFNPTFFNLDQPYWQMIITVMTRLLTSAIQLSAPALVGIMMADMFLGIANRLAPQVQIAFLGIPVKSILALGLLSAAWFVVLRQMSFQSITWLKDVLKAIHTF